MKKYICEECREIITSEHGDLNGLEHGGDCFGFLYSASELISEIAESIEGIPFDAHRQAIDKADDIKSMCKLLEILTGEE